MSGLIKPFRHVLAIAGLAAIALAVFCAAPPAVAQGSRKDDVVFNAQGRPMAGAAVRVCTSAATGQPCSPLAQIYSDPGLTQALANPTAADGMGNYTFYASPGRYEIELSGPGITTKQLPNVILPSDPTSPTFTTVTTTSGMSAFSLSLTGNLTVSGSAAVTGALTVGGAQVPTAAQENQWTASQHFCGPDPWFDITCFGARSVTSVPQSNVTITGGTNAATFSNPANFKLNDWVVIDGAGAACALATPTAPAVAPGNLSTLMVPISGINSVTGSSTWNYILFARDNAGCVSPASPATTITNGLASLGMQSMSITSESLSGTTLTVVVGSTAGLHASDLVDLQGSTDARLDGFFPISSINNGTTFTIINTPVNNVTSTAVTSTGGTLYYTSANQLTWSFSTGAVQYGVCREGPGDSSYHLIGFSYPYNTSAQGNGAGSLIFTDYGSTATTAPLAPAYVGDSLCVNSSTRNAYLVAQITAINYNTGAITLSTNAVNSVTNALAEFTDGPELLAAATALKNNQFGGHVHIPPPSQANGFYPIKNAVDLTFGGTAGPRISIIQEGQVNIYETLTGPDRWSGQPAGSGEAIFAQGTYPGIACYVSPCVYTPPGSVPNYDHLGWSTSGNNYVELMIDTGNDFGGKFNDMWFSSSIDSSDYVGTPLVVRNGRQKPEFTNLSFANGPGGTNAHKTTTPALYTTLGNCGSTIYSVEEPFLRHINFEFRGVLLQNPPIEATDVYEEGGQSPAITLSAACGTFAFSFGPQFNEITDDSSPVQQLLVLSTAFPNKLDVTMSNLGGLSNDTGGPPPVITGVAPSIFRATGMPPSTAGLPFPTIGPGGTNSSVIYTNFYSPMNLSGPTVAATTFSNLTACSSSLEGASRAVTDSTTNTWGATITGGGSNHVMAYCDGTNWTVMAK